MPITSPQNEKLKNLRRLRQRRRDRERAGQFVAEGEDLLAAADAAGWQPLERFAVTDSGLPGVEVDPAVLDRFSELGSGTRTMAIYEQRWRALAEISPRRCTCVYLHGVSDPGNVGTVLRSAAAFGAGCVAFGSSSADPFGPKAVRASMGAIFSVPVVRAEPADLPGLRVALDARAPAALADVISMIDPDIQVSLLIGAEREGLPRDVISTADHLASIPILTESLNAAIAASVALYELVRSGPATVPGPGSTT
jgi:TrmH family RNA methyltransferase